MITKEKQKEILIDLMNDAPIDKEKHKLEYNIHSTKVTWCPICKEHFYNEVSGFHSIINKDNRLHEDTAIKFAEWVLHKLLDDDEKEYTVKELFEQFKQEKK